MNSLPQEENIECTLIMENTFNSVVNDPDSQSQNDNCCTGEEASETACTDSNSSLAVSDPYSYLNRGDYTSEAFKLELMNLPKRFGIAVSLCCLLYLLL
jgi:hypothetical protein